MNAARECVNADRVQGSLTSSLWCRKPVKEFLDAVRAVKSSDIAELVSKMIKTPLSMACLGDIAGMPRYNAVQSRFK